MTSNDVLRDLKPTPSGYLSAAREIEALGHTLKPLKVAILSTFTADLLRPYLVVESARRGLLVTPIFGPVNQLEQQVFDGSSRLYESNPDVVVIASRLEEFAPKLTVRFITLSPDEIENELARIEERLTSLIEGLRQFTTATILIFNYAAPVFLETSLGDTSLAVSQTSTVQRANERVAKISQNHTGVHVIDFARMAYEVGLRRWFDPKLWYLGRIPLGSEAQLETGRRLARYLRAVCFPAGKCLVVDLDNTLWGGVIGEDGLGGIALGEDYPGSVYKDFHRRLLSLRNQGVLLAIASKNNEADVHEVFQKHPDCLLKLEHFAACQINWQDKATSLAAIARELNIGTDALVFFDDSQFEREWIRSKMPEVNVIDVPEGPLEFVRALEDSGAFDRLTVSAEDHQRAEMYREAQQRKQLETKSASIEEFLKQLEMTVVIGNVGAATLPRVAQMLGKTNQFNLTSRRHTGSEVEAMIAAGAIALWLRVQDRFGDNGLVGVAIAIPRDRDQWILDSFLLSCRVLGRKIESVLLSILSDMIRQRGGQTLLGEFIPTTKNGVASRFYAEHGFVSFNGDGRLWSWDLRQGRIGLPDLVHVRFDNG